MKRSILILIIFMSGAFNFLYASEKADEKLTSKELLDKGITCYMKKDYDRAYDYYKKALKANPRYSIVHKYMGLVDMVRKEIEKARENLLKAYVNHPDSDELCFEIGETYEYNSSGVQYGDGFDANICIYYYKKAVEINKRNAEAYFKMGKIYYLSKKYDNALNTLKRTVRIKFDYGEAYYYLAKIYEQLKKHDMAIYSYKFAGRLGKDKYWYEESVAKSGQVQ